MNSLKTPDFAEPDLTAAQTYHSTLGDNRAERTPLSSLGLLPQRAHHTSITELSIGQRRRLALAIAVATQPDLLLLDEPTNHLSLNLVSELETAFDTTGATVVVATHDRWIRRRWQHRAITLHPH